MAPSEEYALVRRQVGLLDRADFGVLELTGRDRASFLHALVSNEIKALSPGQGCAATLLDIHGKVQVILFVWVADDRIFVVTPPAMAAKTAEALDHYLFSEKVAIEDVSREHALFVLAGPRALETCDRLTGARPPETPWSHVAAKLGETPVRLVSGGRETGEVEVWIMCPHAEASKVREALVEAGARPIGAEAFEPLRIEAGTPLFGQDVDESVLLPEIPFDGLLSQTKGCYPGQEVVVRIRDRGHVNRMLRGLALEGEQVPPQGAEVVVGDASVGKVTSAAWSFGLSRPIGLAFVRRQHAEPGTRVSVRFAGTTVAATVSALPFAR
ncbi:MAG: aminomethyltransferase family protein [Candidatus Rokuibacteriota bacterium]